MSLVQTRRSRIQGHVRLDSRINVIGVSYLVRLVSNVSKLHKDAGFTCGLA